MATSAVSICNLALAHVHNGRRIQSLTEATEEARQCNTFYEQARRETLEAHNWNFARRRVSLAISAEDPSAEWAYRYGFPDCLKIRYLVNPLGDEADPVPYEIEQNLAGTAKTVLTDLGDAVALCTRDVTDPNLFSAAFVGALSHLLAYYIAGPLATDKTIKQTEFEAFTAAYKVATAGDANERGERQPADADWISGRS